MVSSGLTPRIHREVTSRDRALDVLSAFDREIEIQRSQLIKEFHIKSAAAIDSTDELPKGV